MKYIDMRKKNFEYFLNAIYYCIWLFAIKFSGKIGCIVNMIFSSVIKVFLTKLQKKKFEVLLTRKQQIHDRFFYNKESGVYVVFARRLFWNFYSCYSLFFSFLLAGFILKEEFDVHFIIKFAVFVIPMISCGIPAYRTVFANDRYQTYFKKFDVESEQWHRKWKRITLLFSIGALLSVILGIAACFAILLFL